MMYGSQVTNKRTLPEPKFLEPYNCNKVTTHIQIPWLFPFIASLQIMALRRSVTKDDILCKLYADTYSDVSDDCETEILDSKRKEVMNCIALTIKQARKFKMQGGYS
jgi:hypothetical protein